VFQRIRSSPASTVRKRISTIPPARRPFDPSPFIRYGVELPDRHEDVRPPSQWSGRERSPQLPPHHPMTGNEEKIRCDICGGTASVMAGSFCVFFSM